MRLFLQRMVVVLGVLTVVGYCVYSLATETGVVGWMAQAQMSLFGSHSLKLTVLLLSLLLVPAGFALWGMAAALGWLVPDAGADRAVFGVAPATSAAAHPTTPPAEASRPAAAGPGAGAMWIASLGLVAIAWVAGLGWWAYASWQQRSDAGARYEAVDLNASGGAPLPAGRHLALKGRLLVEHGVTHTSRRGASRRDDYHLMPVVAAQWTRGQAATYLLKVERLDELEPFIATQRAARNPASLPTLLVRLDGEPPVPALQKYASDGVPFTPDRHLVRLVPLVDGQPVGTDSGAVLEEVIAMCGIFTAILALTMPVLWWRMRGTARKPAAQA